MNGKQGHVDWRKFDRQQPLSQGAGARTVSPASQCVSAHMCIPSEPGDCITPPVCVCVCVCVWPNLKAKPDKSDKTRMKHFPNLAAGGREVVVVGGRELKVM